jgi:hypothetical protein
MLVPTRRIILLGLVLAGTVMPSCLAPTLPLPPPDRPHVEGPDEQGNVRLSGTAPESGTVVFALNDRTNQIVGQRTTASSAYVLLIPAQAGDFLSFWYTVGTEQSPSIVFQIGVPGR